MIAASFAVYIHRSVHVSLDQYVNSTKAAGN